MPFVMRRAYSDQFSGVSRDGPDIHGWSGVSAPLPFSFFDRGCCTGWALMPANHWASMVCHLGVTDGAGGNHAIMRVVRLYKRGSKCEPVLDLMKSEKRKARSRL